MKLKTIYESKSLFSSWDEFDEFFIHNGFKEGNDKTSKPNLNYFGASAGSNHPDNKFFYLNDDGNKGYVVTCSIGDPDEEGLYSGEYFFHSNELRGKDENGDKYIHLVNIEPDYNKISRSQITNFIEDYKSGKLLELESDKDKLEEYCDKNNLELYWDEV